MPECMEVMQKAAPRRSRDECQVAWPVWTLGCLAVLVIANAKMFLPQSEILTALVDWLQYDRQAIIEGQWWRFLSGNLVHWSREHFLLDAVAFVIVGLLAESKLRRVYPWLLLAGGAFVGGAMFLLEPQLQTYRGMSGVDSAQFVALLIVECRAACRDRRNWLYVAPALAMFAAKIIYECGTGALFFGTQSLGDLGEPVPAAHAAGAAAAICCWAALWLRKRFSHDAIEPAVPHLESQGGNTAALYWLGGRFSAGLAGSQPRANHPGRHSRTPSPSHPEGLLY